VRLTKKLAPVVVLSLLCGIVLTATVAASNIQVTTKYGTTVLKTAVGDTEAEELVADDDSIDLSKYVQVEALLDAVDVHDLIVWKFENDEVLIRDGVRVKHVSTVKTADNIYVPVVDFCKAAGFQFLWVDNTQKLSVEVF